MPWTDTLGKQGGPIPTNINRLEERPPKFFKGENPDIVFTEADSRWIHHPHNDAFIIEMIFGSKNVHRVFIDNGSSVNILYYDTYKRLGLLDTEMHVENAYVYGFAEEATRVKGIIRLPVTIGEGNLSTIRIL